MSRTITALTFSVLSLALLSACEVNELPSYRTRIETVHLAPRANAAAEVTFVTPYVVDPNDPNAVALDQIERRIRERLANRMAQLGHPNLVVDSYADAMAAEFDRRFSWTRVGPNDEYDALFLVDISEYGASVNAAGHSVVYFEAAIEGRYVQTGTLIYEETVVSEMPLTELYGGGGDAVSEAAARSLNLMALDQMSDAEMQSQILRVAEQAAADLIYELYEDTYE